MTDYAKNFADFLTAASGSPFTATVELKKMLVAAGYVELKEQEAWTLAPNGKYFFLRNASSVFAFSVGGKFDPNTKSNSGFAIVGAHTDSPALRLKPPKSFAKHAAAQTEMIHCETYGGGIWQTWFDRDLGVAGKIIVSEGAGRAAKLTSIPVVIRDPILRIPTIAPHLEQPYADGFKINKEVDLRAVLCCCSAAEPIELNPAVKGRVNPELLACIAEHAGVKVADIVGFDLRLCDTQPAAVCGLKKDFVVGQGIDNLNGSYTTLVGLLEAEGLEEDPNVRLLTLFDHEECGSMSAQGAQSHCVLDTMDRIIAGVLNAKKPEVAEHPRELLLAMARRSFVISVDNAHAIHPNYAGKHEAGAPPVMNAGPVIKHNCNTRYATDAEGTAYLVNIVATHANVPLQQFVIRQDTLCGSTIGSITSAATGIRTVDIGNPQWSMHSIRETCGSADVVSMIKLIKSFYEIYSVSAIPI